MINHIIIENFAIIKKAEINFYKGLNIITGETGSGKSIIVESINLALGGRADSSLVRKGESKAKIQLLGELNGEEVSIVREISTKGKNLCKINGEIATVSQVALLGKRIADIHGQYDNQTLLNSENHINIIDAYGGTELSALKDNYAKAYNSYEETSKELNAFIKNEKNNRAQEDFWKFQVSEISEANLQKDEDVLLQDSIKFMENGEQIYKSTKGSYTFLSEENGAIDLLGNAISNLADISDYSSEIEELLSQLQDTQYNLQDVSASLENICDSVTFSQNELDSSISRLNKIENLKKKYGNSVDEILLYEKNLVDKINKIENFDFEIKKLKNILSEKEAVLLETGNKLKKLRMKVSDKLSSEIEKQLEELNFSNSIWQVNWYPLSSPSANGLEMAEFYISTNKGEDPKPLAKTASGGEISRIMLAIKNITSDYVEKPTMIFDEIDTGISGQTAAIVGKKLVETSYNKQIICITHLPQIACKANHAYKIQKEVIDESTYTTVIELNHDNHIREIARLLGSEKITETTLENAKELIES